MSRYIPESLLSERLAKVRALMKAQHISAFVVPHDDAHGSEYLAKVDERLAYITGFDGSAGTAVITPSEALLWTDGRYFLQAQSQFSKDWKLMKDRLPETPSVAAWLTKSVGKVGNVGLDPSLCNVSYYRELVKTLTVKCVDKNIVDEVWRKEKEMPYQQPTRPAFEVRFLADQFTGEAVESKLKKLRAEMKEKGATFSIFTQLDDIAWLLNMRGKDIEYNPLFFSYLVVKQNDSAYLFVHNADKRFSEDAKSSLKKNNISLKGYDSVCDFLKVSSGNVDPEDKVWLDPSSCNVAILKNLEGVRAGNLIEDPLPVQRWKAVKNAKESEGARNAHKRDGLAKSRWLFWLEQELEKGRTLSEAEAADKLEQFRSKQNLYAGLSFAPISSSGANAAIIHYHASKRNCAKIDKNKIYLIDSGGQYDDGTTDTTRTVHFGEPSEEEKVAFTAVLRGNISLSLQKFPKGTSGLDFRHSVGHGVGAYLCVHEGPIAICPPGQRPGPLKSPLEVGNLLSNEPGFYKDGEFGIRIENVMLVVETSTKNVLKPEEKFLGFETVTMVPIQRKMIKPELLKEEEVEWLDSYHRKVFDHLKGGMETKEEKAWLEKMCAPLRGGGESPRKRRASSAKSGSPVKSKRSKK